MQQAQEKDYGFRRVRRVGRVGRQEGEQDANRNAPAARWAVIQEAADFAVKVVRCIIIPPMGQRARELGQIIDCLFQVIQPLTGIFGAKQAAEIKILSIAVAVIAVTINYDITRRYLFQKRPHIKPCRSASAIFSSGSASKIASPLV